MTNAPFFIFLGLAQNLKGSRILEAGIGIKPASTASGSTSPASKEPAPAIHAPQASRGIDELEGTLVLLVIIGVLGSTGAHLANVLVHVATISVRRTGPVRNLNGEAKPSTTTFRDSCNCNLQDNIWEHI